MPLNIKKSGGICRISIDGDMTIFNASLLKADIQNSLDECSGFEIDLSGVGEMDTAGFQLLIMMKREAAANSKTFRIASQSAATSAVTALYNMEEFFNN